MWIAYAFLSAFFASLVAIFGKIGLKAIDSTLATTIRAIIMAAFLALLSLALKKFNGFHLSSFSAREWLFIALSGVAGALSWLCYFFALKNGPTTAVSAIDRTSVIFVAVLAALFLGDSFGWKTGLGALLVAAGAFLITLK